MEYRTLNLLFKCNKEFSHKRIRMHNLSDTEYMICSYIYSHDNISQNDISQALKTDKTTIGKAIFSLEKKKYILRTKDKTDKRINRVELTKKGKIEISYLLNIHNIWLEQIMTCLSENERKDFENYCLRLLDTAEKLIKTSEDFYYEA